MPGEEERRYLLVKGGGGGGEGGESKWAQEEEGLLEEVVKATQGLTHAATALVWDRAAMSALRRRATGGGEEGEEVVPQASQCTVSRQDAMDAIQQLARDGSIQ